MVCLNIGFIGKNIAVIDERGEIAAMHKGLPQNDLGLRTDVIENIDKDKGIQMLIRSMAPEIICTDEIGTKEDCMAIKKAACLGVKFIFTAHAQDLEDLNSNIEINDLINKKIFKKIVFLKKGFMPR